MHWDLIIPVTLIWLLRDGSTLQPNQKHPGSKSFQISPKPCKVNNLDGTCMFVWECIKSEGEHLGMCVDAFMFGSCCAHNPQTNVIDPYPIDPVDNHGFDHDNVGHFSDVNNKYDDGPTILYLAPDPVTSHMRPVNHNALNSFAYETIPHTKRNNSASGSDRPLDVLEFNETSYVLSHTTSNSVYNVDDGKFSNPSTSSNSVTTSSSNKRPSVTQQTLHTAQNDEHHHSTIWKPTTEPNFITKPRPGKPPAHYMNNVYPKPTKKTTPSTTTPSTTTALVNKSTTQKIFYLTNKRPNKPNNRPPHNPSRPVINASRPAVNASRPSSVSTVLTVVQGDGQRPNQSTVLNLVKPGGNFGPYDKLNKHPTVPPNQQNKQTSTEVTAVPLVSVTFSPTSAAMMPTSTLSPINMSNDPKKQCGLTPLFPRPEKRIVGGKSAQFGRWPWQVSVRRTSFFGFSSTHRCGGAILNANWIATAGHCVDDLLTSQIRIRVGEYDFSKQQQDYPFVERMVAKKVVHPKYNFFTYEYDLALVKLDKSLDFAPHIVPICLPASDDLLIGENATVTGWGRLSEGGTLPSVLQQVQVPIVSNDRCKSMFLRAGRVEHIPEIFLCAGHETGGQDSCQGDSGGPLQVKGKDGRYFLAGIISWGIGCAEANLPGVCTRISKFVPWILENVT